MLLPRSSQHLSGYDFSHLFVSSVPVAATHKETKQFYTLYNTLDDTKLYLSKEVNLLNSIHDNFEQ